MLHVVILRTTPFYCKDHCKCATFSQGRVCRDVGEGWLLVIKSGPHFSLVHFCVCCKEVLLSICIRRVRREENRMLYSTHLGNICSFKNAKKRKIVYNLSIRSFTPSHSWRMRPIRQFQPITVYESPPPQSPSPECQLLFSDVFVSSLLSYDNSELVFRFLVRVFVWFI